MGILTFSTRQGICLPPQLFKRMFALSVMHGAVSFCLVHAQSQEWTIQGNAGVGNGAFIGTVDSSDFKVRTSNHERLTVGADGSVRIERLQSDNMGLVFADPAGILQKSDPGSDSLWDCSQKYWRANGNYMTPNCFIGTTNPEAFRVYTSNQERMRVSSGGLVGIGTTAPTAPLHVAAPSTGTAIRLQSAGSNAPVGMAFAAPGTTVPSDLAGIQAGHNLSLGRAELSLRVRPAGGGALQEALHLDAVASDFKGRLGVGATAHASDRMLVNGFQRITAQNTPGSFLRMGHTGQEAVIEHAIAGPGSSGINRLHINPSGGRTDFGGNVVMGANLGVGTANFLDPSTGKDYRLSVDGRIRAEEVKVYSGWADHVFEPGYRLMPLPEVSAYIAANRHLPGMPTASQVAEEGVELGATQAKLLEKIEELTLHVIRLDEDNLELRERLLDLEGGK